MEIWFVRLPFEKQKESYNVAKIKSYSVTADAARLNSDDSNCDVSDIDGQN